MASLLAPVRERLHASKNAVVPFVGSGLSLPALPSWRAFLTSMIDLAPASRQATLERYLDAGEYLAVAELLEREPSVGRSMVSTELERVFQRPKAQPPAVYDLVAALPTEHFLTTNWDPWLERAVGKRHPAPRVYVPDDGAALADLDHTSPPLVLKLHGDAARPQTCVLASPDYRRLTHGQSFVQAMTGLAAHRRFLFLGYSLTDPDITHVLDSWAAIFAPKGGALRHVLLGAGIDEVTHMKLTSRSVMPVDYSPDDPNDHSALPDILLWLATPPS